MEKMKIFVSWSGPRSAAVAEALKEYLPTINNAFDLWLSSDDIASGSRSTLEIAKALTLAQAGIICLTPSNLTSPWILFEAGGIAKTVDNTRVCTVLIDLKPSDVGSPLGDFQHTTRLNEKELLKLVKDLNSAAGDSARKDADIEKSFKLCWPELKAKLENLPSDGPTKRPKREPQEMLEELLDLARTTSAQVEEVNGRITVEFDTAAKLRAEKARMEAWERITRDAYLASASGTLSDLNGSTEPGAQSAERSADGRTKTPRRGALAEDWIKASRAAAKHRTKGEKPADDVKKE